MKLLFVIDGLGSGGAQRQMVNLAVGLKRKGHTIEFFIYHPKANHFQGIVESEGIKIHFSRKSNRFSLTPPWQLLNLLRNEKYDGVLAFLVTSSFYCELNKIALRKKMPVLVVSERFMFPTEKLPLWLWGLQQLHRLADFVTVNSIHQRLKMERMFPWLNQKISTIYNGVDDTFFVPELLPKKKEAESVLLLVVATITEKKNVLGLIKALAYAKEKFGIQCRIGWAGKVGTDHASKIEFEMAKKLVESNFLGDCWSWLGESSDIQGLLRECDALIHPSFFEGLPNSICEALAAGKPILASSVCDHPHLVQNSVNGFLFNPHEIESIAGAIMQFSELAPEERLQMGRESRKYALNRLTMKRYADEYEELFLRLIRSRDLE